MTAKHNTINEIFLHVVDNLARDDVYLVRNRKSIDRISTAEVFSRVKSLVSAFTGAGVKRGDRVAIIAENSVNWPIWDFAILGLGAVSVPFYTSLPAEQLLFMIRDSGAKLIYCSDKIQTGKVLTIKEELPELEYLVNDKLSDKEQVLTVEEFVESYGDKRFTDGQFREILGNVKSDDLATLLYTSGTTGVPKGVMLSHGNLASDVVGSAEVIKSGIDDIGLSALPLCHSFQRMADYVIFYGGGSICHAPNPGMIMSYVKDIHPTFIASVPRFQEKMYAGILKNISAKGKAEKKLALWALDVATKWADVYFSGKKPSFFLSTKYKLAYKFALSKIRATMGDNFKFFISGGGPLPIELCKLFYGMGITIVEGYGLTETSPVVCLNERTICPGTVGKAIPGVEVKIAGDGELLVKGPIVMKGYFNRPEETAEVMKEDWLLTGDIAEIDSAGRVSITGRKKELIVLSNGKNIYPQPVENLLLQIEVVNQAVIFGDNQKYIAALVVPDEEALLKVADENSWKESSFDEILQSEEFFDYFKEKLGEVNEKLPDYERIRKFAFVAEEFSVVNECLTPTLKLRRSKIADIYKELINKLF